MNADTLLENFEILAEAPSGVAHLKQLILDLAITGKLVKSETTSISMERKIRQLWEQIPEKERESVRFRRSERMPFVLESTIPDHWISTFVEALTKLQTGATPSRAKPEYFKGNVKWLVSGDIKYSNISDCVGRISEKALKETNCKMIPINSVLIALNGQGKTRATVSILRVEATCNQSLVSMTPRDPQILTCEFLYLFLRSKYKRIREITGADDRRGLNMNIVSSLQISVPPIAEQRQIVDRVDELLALCDELEQQQKRRDSLRTATRKSAIDAISTATTPEELEAAWKRINNNWEVIADTPESVGSLRSLILDLAVRGRLQNEVDQEFDLVSGLPIGWELKRLDQVCSYVQRGKGPKYADLSKYAVVSQKCVQWTGFDISKARFVDEQSLNSYGEERILRSGDILWNSTGTGTVGRTAIYFDSNLFEKVVADSHVTVLRAPDMNPQFLWSWTASPAVQSMIADLTSGTTNQQELNLSSIKSLLVPIPPLTKQNSIVTKVEELMALCDQLESELTSRSEVAEKFARSVVNVA